MSGGVGVDRIRGTGKLSDVLKSKYKCYCDPEADNKKTRNKYLTSLQVFGNRDVEDEPQSTSFSSQIIKKKITNALMVMSFREPHVLVQFWSPIAVGKRCLLTTLDQPFGLGVVDEGLYLYRVKSEQRVLVVDEEHREELAPPGRVYWQKMPEWSLDIQSLSTRQCVQDYAACSNIHGYINLPVFEPASGSCVGVLELITSSNYVDYAFEVREVTRALKEENLKSPNVFEDTRFYVGDERSQYELDEIFVALKLVCDVQMLPLAQTWALAGYSSVVVANSGNLEKGCSSFNKRCIGKTCMSTSALPFYVRDLSTWGFYEACGERHLDKSQGVVGRSLSSHGVCFCGDVTNLSEDEYPFVPYARVNGITSSLAVYLKSLVTDVEYVIEFFLPPHSIKEADLQSVVKRLLKTVRQQIKISSKVQLGIMSSPQVIGGIPFHWNPESSSSSEKEESPPESEDEQPLVEKQQNDVDVLSSKNQSEVTCVERDNFKYKPPHSTAAVTSESVVPCSEVGTENLDDNAWKTRKKLDDNSDKPRKRRKRTDRTNTISQEEISKHYGKTMEDAAVSLCVSRSTLKRICRSLGIPRWPYKNGPDKNDSLLKPNQTLVAIDVSEEAHTPLFGASGKPFGITDITFDHATLIKHGEHSSMLLSHQQEQTYLSDNSAQPGTTTREKYIEYGNHSSTLVPRQQEQKDPLDRFGQLDTTISEKYIENIAARTVENVMIKATYRENTVKFAFNLSDGLVKLEELVAARFQLKLGSFSLKYVDEDGDMILIACDNDLMASLSAFKQPNIQTLIRILVWPVVQ